MKGAAIGMNLGTHSARVAFVVSGGSVSLIPNRLGKTAMPSAVDWKNSARHTLQDRLVPLILTLREDAEVHLNGFVTSCVLAVPTGVSEEQREIVTRAATAAGIEEAGVIPEPCAAALAMSCRGRSLVLDFGAGTTLSVVELKNGEGHVLESVRDGLPGGRDFDAALAAWLRERLCLLPEEGDLRQRTLLYEAEQIKIELSKKDSLRWTPPSVTGWPSSPLTVYREDFECLVRFSLRRIIHTVRRMWTQYAPAHLIPTGGASVIPLLQTLLQQEAPEPRHLVHGAGDAVVRGAAIQASREASMYEGENVSPEEAKDLSQRLRDLKMSLLELETLLNRPQQERLHLLFQRAESAPPNPALLRLIEGLVHDLKQAVE